MGSAVRRHKNPASKVAASTLVVSDIGNWRNSISICFARTCAWKRVSTVCSFIVRRRLLAERQPRRIDPILHAKRLEDRRHMYPNGIHAHPQGLGNFLVRTILRQ